MRFLRKKNETHLYGWTEGLSLRNDMLECTSNGQLTEAVAITTLQSLPEPQPAHPDALKSIDWMDKDELEQYARDTFNAELDRRKSIADLRTQVHGLTSGDIDADDVANGIVEKVDEPNAPIPEPELKKLAPEFETKNDAISWAKERELGISFRSRDSKNKAIERIEKVLREQEED